MFRPARRPFAILAWAFLLGASPPSPADERLEGIACRSAHLGDPAAEGVAFSNKVTIDQSAPRTSLPKDLPSPEEGGR